MATKDKRESIKIDETPIQDYDGLKNARKRDNEFHQTVFRPADNTRWEFTKPTVSSLKDLYRSISTTSYKPAKWHITFDHKLNKDEVFPVPYQSVPGDTYKRFVTRIRTITNMWHYKDIDADTYDRLVEYMRHKKVRIGDSKRTLADLFLDE